MEFLETNKLTNCNHYDFRREKSTNYAIAVLASKPHKTLEDSDPYICVFLDLTKATPLPTTIILKVMEDTGIIGVIVNKLISRYFEDRKQFVR